MSLHGWWSAEGSSAWLGEQNLFWKSLNKNKSFIDFRRLKMVADFGTYNSRHENQTRCMQIKFRKKSDIVY